MAADDKQIAANDGGRVAQARIALLDLDTAPQRRLDIKHPHVLEAFVAVAAAKNDQLAAHHVGRVVAAGVRLDQLLGLGSGNGDPRRRGVVVRVVVVVQVVVVVMVVEVVRGGRGRGHQFPAGLAQIGHVEAPDVVEGADAVTAAKDVDAVLVEAGSVGAAAARLGAGAGQLRA